MSASLLVLMNSFLFIFSLGLSYARFLPGILVTSASCPHFFRMTVTQAVWFSFPGIQLPVLNSQVKRNHSNSTRDSRHQYENQEGHPLAAQLKSQTRGRPRNVKSCTSHGPASDSVYSNRRWGEVTAKYRFHRMRVKCDKFCYVVLTSYKAR